MKMIIKTGAPFLNNDSSHTASLSFESKSLTLIMDHLKMTSSVSSGEEYPKLVTKSGLGGKG